MFLFQSVNEPGVLISIVASFRLFFCHSVYTLCPVRHNSEQLDLSFFGRISYSNVYIIHLGYRYFRAPITSIGRIFFCYTSHIMMIRIQTSHAQRTTAAFCLHRIQKPRQRGHWLFCAGFSCSYQDSESKHNVTIKINLLNWEIGYIWLAIWMEYIIGFNSLHFICWDSLIYFDQIKLYYKRGLGQT